MTEVDAVVVGSGPNGLAAAVALARAGLSVQVHEAAAQPGGGCTTAELTLPGFRHDVCSAVHPLAVASPFFRSLDLPAHGLRFAEPPVQFAHPLDDGNAGAVLRSVDATALGLGPDVNPYRRLFTPLTAAAGDIAATVLAPLRSLPRRPQRLARFAVDGLMPATTLARRFDTEAARGLFAGAAAHAMLPLDTRPSGAFGLLLGLLAHAVGWPFVAGGSGELTTALVAELTAHGGVLVTGHRVASLAELPSARVVLLDLTPRQVLAVAGSRLPSGYRRAVERYRYGPGVCKVDWALAGPVPWSAPECRSAGTVHVGGSLADIAAGEADVAAGRHPDRPFVLVTQPSVVDPSRAPAGRHVLWGYCHVPSGSTVDMTDAIEAQIERFAPGFRDLVLARVTSTARDEERRNPNFVGGDINGGAMTLRQIVFRPAMRWSPYRTPLAGVYLCSSATPPGGGVHGMCGANAARTALRDLHRRPPRPAAALR